MPCQQKHSWHTLRTCTCQSSKLHKTRAPAAWAADSLKSRFPYAIQHAEGEVQVQGNSFQSNTFVDELSQVYKQAKSFPIVAQIGHTKPIGAQSNWTKLAQFSHEIASFIHRIYDFSPFCRTQIIFHTMNNANTAWFCKKLNVMYNRIPDFPDSKVNRMSEWHTLIFLRCWLTDACAYYFKSVWECFFTD